VLGKFFASLALLAVGVVLTGTYVLTAAWLGNLDGGVTLAGYAGMLFMGAAYLSIGLYASAITNNQIVAFILGIVLIFLFYYFDKVIIFLPGYLVGLFEYLSVDFHYRNFVRGVIDSRDIIYYLSVITAALMLAGHSLETRKWS
jgi:ABC-2 type transport system permease protein